MPIEYIDLSNLPKDENKEKIPDLPLDDHPDNLPDDDVIKDQLERDRAKRRPKIEPEPMYAPSPGAEEDPNRMPEYDPDAKRRWEDEQRRREGNTGGPTIIET
jgi:hypothetical protein